MMDESIEAHSPTTTLTLLAVPGNGGGAFRFDRVRSCLPDAVDFLPLTPDWFNRLQSVMLPAGLIWGAEERLLSPGHISQFQRLLPDCRVWLVVGWGHFPMIEEPQAFASVVTKLIQEVLS